MQKNMTFWVVVLMAYFAHVECQDGDIIRVFKDISGGSVEGPVLQESSVIAEPSDECFTRSGCACLKQWFYRGIAYEGCANPDTDYKSSWCQVDTRTCSSANTAVFKDSLKYYGYCSCQNKSASPSPIPSPSQAASSMLPEQSGVAGVRNSLLIDVEDCVTIINRGCTKYHFFMTFTDGGLIESKEYFDYYYQQSSGWWMLDNVVNDFTRWCSPTKTIGLYFVVEDSRDFQSSLFTSKSVGETFRCMNTDFEFEYLTYHYNRTMDGHSGTTTFTPFYVDHKSKVREPECSGIGGEFRSFQLIPTNTTLVINASCQFADNF